MKKEILSQKEINNLKIDENTTIEQDIKNVIILCRNELNILDETLNKYQHKVKKSILKKLNKILTRIIKLRK